MCPSNSSSYKRLIICCDGTGVDGLTDSDSENYTNVLRIARALDSQDTRGEQAVDQIVFYLSGLGSEGTFASIAEGVTGARIASKLDDCYAFIASNWRPDDEIFFFGFSRGAYTVRMVAAMILEIGILNKRDMEAFPALFLALQKQGDNPGDEEIRHATEKLLAPYRAAAKAQAAQLDSPFIVKCVGVFDTVGAIGLPVEILPKSVQPARDILGFSNNDLGEHIELALHALALDETRKNYFPMKWHQTEAGRTRKQVLKQVWFSGDHSDVGGGHADMHDLSDLSLAWMVAETSAVLSWDFEYLKEIPDPSAPYGEQPPHDPRRGLSRLQQGAPRAPPVFNDEVLHETVHYSATLQPSLPKAVRAVLEQHPGLVRPLLPLEQAFKDGWSFTEGRAHRPPPRQLSRIAEHGKMRDEQQEVLEGAKGEDVGQGGLLERVLDKIKG